MPEINALHSALIARQNAGLEIINLIDSRFHENGFIMPPSLFIRSFETYLRSRKYDPHPLGLAKAREAVAAFYTDGGPVTSGGLSTDPDQIVFTASSSEAYLHLFSCFAEPGDNILLPLPSYPLFEDLAQYAHLETRFYPLDPDKDWQPDIDVMDVLTDNRTRFIVIISPNNPTGSIVSESNLDRISRLCAESGTMIISDEVFSEFLYGEEDLEKHGDIAFSRQVLPRAAHFSDRTPVFTINGISKMFASPDLKLSWISVHAPKINTRPFPDTAEIMHRLELRNDTFLNAAPPVQFLLPDLFTEAVSFVRDMVGDLSRNRRVFAKTIASEACSNITTSPPEAGIHTIIRLPSVTSWTDESLSLRLLSNQGLYVHPGYLYGIDEEVQLVVTILGKNPLWASGMHTLFSQLADLVR